MHAKFLLKIGSSVTELPAGQVSEFLVGFTNKGEQDMVVDSVEASLRYPMDFTYHIQNFSAIAYSKVQNQFLFPNQICLKFISTRNIMIMNFSHLMFSLKDFLNVNYLWQYLAV